MAHLIKTIALGGQRNSDNFSFPLNFGTSSDSPGPSYQTGIFAEQPRERYALIRGLFSRASHSSSSKGVEIRKTKEFVVRSTPCRDVESNPQRDSIGRDTLALSWAGRPDGVHLNESRPTQSNNGEDSSTRADRHLVTENVVDTGALVEPSPAVLH